MVSTDEYRQVHALREQALDRGDLVATSSWSVAD
jgi:hypothetical protein